MTPPRQLYRVEWRAARYHDRPNDRTEQVRHFATAENAGAQVRRVRSWEPSHTELIGVWLTGSSSWTPVDPDTLPVPPHVEAQCRVREAARAGEDTAPLIALLTTDTEE